MSTVVALGHFCEVHGPRLVFYTIRNINEPQFVSQCPDLKFCSGCKAPLLEGYISTVQTVHSTPTQTPSESPATELGLTCSGEGVCGRGLGEGGAARVPGEGAAGGRGLGAEVPAARRAEGVCGRSGEGPCKGLPRGILDPGIRSSSHQSQPIYSNISASSSGQSVRTAHLNGPHQSSSSRRRTSSNVVIDDGGGGRPSPATATTTTNPTGATKYYCSHSNYDHSHLSHLHSCIARTLSCELSPSNSVAFTSSDIWVIGTAFSLKDSQARGFHRRYCLIFTFLPESSIPCIGHVTGALPVGGGGRGAASSTKTVKAKNNPGGPKHHHHHQQHPGPPRGGRDEYYSDGDYKGTSSAGANYYPSLVPYYEYITEEFYNVAKSLQSECEKVYFKEQSLSPQRAIRLSTLLDGSGTSGATGTSSTLPGATRPGGAKVFTRNHSSAAGARSLPLLTSNPHIFLDLHEKFAKILHHVDL